jgi:uncharacterized protein (TIRG00374 family)
VRPFPLDTSEAGYHEGVRWLGGMNTFEAAAKRRAIPKWALPVAGYVISALSLIWVFSRFPFAQLGEHLRELDWTWVAIAIAAELAIYFADAWRWMILLRPVGTPSFGCCLQAVFVGLFANDILPAKAGEIIRCFLLSFKTDVPVSLALTSDVILRIMDGLWIVILYLFITFQVESHVWVTRIMTLFGAGAVSAALIILWILFHRQHAHNFMNENGWAARFIHLLEEIHRLGHWREMGIAMAIGAIYWALQAFSVWSICRADSFYFNASDIVFILVVKTVGTLFPSAPANMGLYQTSAVYALSLLLTEKGEAEILSEIMFVVLTLPLVVGGAIAIASAGFNLTDLHRHAHNAHSNRKALAE